MYYVRKPAVFLLALVPAGSAIAPNNCPRCGQFSSVRVGKLSHYGTIQKGNSQEAQTSPFSNDPAWLSLQHQGNTHSEFWKLGVTGGSPAKPSAASAYQSIGINSTVFSIGTNWTLGSYPTCCLQAHWSWCFLREWSIMPTGTNLPQDLQTITKHSLVQWQEKPWIPNWNVWKTQTFPLPLSSWFERHRN